MERTVPGSHDGDAEATGVVNVLQIASVQREDFTRRVIPTHSYAMYSVTLYCI